MLSSFVQSSTHLPITMSSTSAFRVSARHWCKLLKQILRIGAVGLVFSLDPWSSFLQVTYCRKPKISKSFVIGRCVDHCTSFVPGSTPAVSLRSCNQDHASHSGCKWDTSPATGLVVSVLLKLACESLRCAIIFGSLCYMISGISVEGVESVCVF